MICKFIGDENDPLTKIFKIEKDKEYFISLWKQDFFARLWNGIEYKAWIIVNGTTVKVPYGSKKSFLRNWEIVYQLEEEKI